jgi:LysR family nitrogen assimilation transcriptional regulator
MNTGYITGFLNSGVIDLGFMFMADTPGFHFRHLVTERLCVVGPSGAFGAGPSARLGSMPLKDVEGLELILPTTLHSLRQLLEDYARRYRLKLNVLAEVNSVQQLIDVVREGIGYTILSYPSIRDELMAGFVSGAMIDSPSIARPAYLCRSALVAPTRAATEVEALIVDVARDLVLKGHWTAKLAPELAGS